MGFATVAIAPQPAQALSPDQISGIAKQVTVLIDGQNPGSGVIINRTDDTYTVLTAFHVVGTPDEYDVVTPTDQRYKLDYKTVKRLPGVDLAVLRFKSDKTYKVANLGNSTQVQEGKPIYVAGFPQPTQAINLSIYRFTEGRLTANSSKPLADGYALVYNNSTRPGMSGGPVLDDQGTVVGIHGRSDAQQQGNVYFKNDTNLGIPIDTFSTMAPRIGVRLESIPATSSPKPTNPASTPIPPQPVQTLPEPQGPRAGDFYLQATDKLQRSNYEGALQDLNQAIQLNPNYAIAYSDRATVKFEQGDRQGAIDDLDRAIQLDPQLADAYGTRGIYRVAVGNIQGAESDVEQAIRLKPEIGYTARGVVLWYGRNLKGALSAFDQALSLKSDFKDAYTVHYFRGVVRWQLGERQSALEDLNRSIQLNPNFFEAVGIRGVFRFLVGDERGAFRDLGEASQINTTNGDVFAVRGLIRLIQGDNQGAISDFDRAIQMKPNDLDSIYFTRGITYFQVGDNQQALASIRRAIQLAEDSESQASYRQMERIIDQAQSQPALRPQIQSSLQSFLQGNMRSFLEKYTQSYRPLQGE